MMTTTPTIEADYSVRQFRSDDLPGVVSLRELVLGSDAEEAEFVWKAMDPPTASRGRTTIAESDGKVVGVAGTVALPFRVDGETVMAAQFVDSLVHPDYRQRGILASIAFDLYEHSSEWASLLHAFPMPMATDIIRDSDSIADILRGADVDLRVEPFPEFYRVQRPSALRPRGPTRVVRAIEDVAKPAVRAYRRVRSRSPGRHEGADVRRHETVPVDELAALYRRTVPDAPHLERNEDLYRWRFTNPQWEYTAYTAEVEEETVAALVVGSISFGPDLTLSRLTEVLPLDASTVDDTVVADLLSAAIADHRESAVVAAGGSGIPRSILEPFGFLPGDSRLLSTALTSPIFYRTSLAYLPYRSAGGEERALDDWLLTYYGPEIG